MTVYGDQLRRRREFYRDKYKLHELGPVKAEANQETGRLRKHRELLRGRHDGATSYGRLG